MTVLPLRMYSYTTLPTVFEVLIPLSQVTFYKFILPRFQTSVNMFLKPKRGGRSRPLGWFISLSLFSFWNREAFPVPCLQPNLYSVKNKDKDKFQCPCPSNKQWAEQIFFLFCQKGGGGHAVRKHSTTKRHENCKKIHGTAFKLCTRYVHQSNGKKA